MPNNATSKTINAALLKRFGAEFDIDPELTGLNDEEAVASEEPAGEKTPLANVRQLRP